MGNNFIVIAYYTRKTGYEEEAKKLVASLEKFNLPYDIEAIDNLGNWQRNTHYKATFLRKMLDKRKEDLVYLDADAIVRKYPALFDDMDADLAVHIRENIEPLSGTLYLTNNEAIRPFIDDLIVENKRNPEMHDEMIFGKVLDKWKERLNIFYLPATYAQIFDLMSNAGEPVIEHFQLSRRLKEKINVAI